MIKGQVIRAGTMDVNGETITGVFVECEISELRDNEKILYEIVNLLPVEG